uniref:Uncharacterized protein n=1 Tax=Meloidogyne hapla TaxID=6305 RepID=A0A1I8BAU9_MELHA
MEEDNDWFSKDFQNDTQTLEDNLNSQIIEKHSKQINEKKNQKEIILLNDNEEELISNDGTEAADIFKKNENLIKENENELMEFDDCWLSKNIQNQQKTNTIKESSVEKPLSPLKNLIKQKELKINEKIKEIGIEPVETLNLNNEENKDDDISTEPGEIPPSDCESSETEPGEIPPSENESFGTEPGELPLSDFEEEDEKVNNSLNQNWIIGKDERNEKINCCSDTVIVIRMGIL